MEITKKDIEHIANLSSLILSEEEIDSYSKDMAEIVTFVNKINELDTEGVDETNFALEGVNVFRKDEVKPSTSRELLLKNAPSTNGVSYELPPVIVE